MQTQNKVTINRKFDCAAEELFRWLIDPALIVQWFGPKHLSVGEVQTNPIVGGAYCIELLKPDGQSFHIQGEYLEITVPSMLSFSLQYNGLPVLPPDSIVSMKIEAPNQNESTLSFIQNFVSEPSDMANRTTAWEHMFEVLSHKMS